MKQKTSLFAILFAVVLFSGGCVTSSQLGFKALKQGEYEKTLSIFEKAAQEDPQNSDVKEGLRLLNKSG